MNDFNNLNQMCLFLEMIQVQLYKHSFILFRGNLLWLVVILNCTYTIAA